MKRIAITGGNGFLGFHLRAAAREFDIEVQLIKVGEEFDLEKTIEALNGVEELIHLAGVNRGTDEEVREGNLLFAAQIAEAVEKSSSDIPKIVFANSIQSGNGTVYGAAKEEAAALLEERAKSVGAEFRNLLLPNLFGEFGQPFYNSVVATFCHQIANGVTPEVQNDKELMLLHAQNAAEYLLGILDDEAMELVCEKILVSDIKALLIEFAQLYSKGEFPDLATKLRRDLFNTYRSYLFPEHAPLNIVRHADNRGSFFEIVRSNGGTGQTSFSTTVPGITRGDHFHRRKVERFTVLSGEAEISLRKILNDEVFVYKVSGEAPLSIDMPTFYTHKIENVGDQTLYTAFWTNDIFDPVDPDTIVEAVK
ncbi:polysaccharide biosynthesis C-terminal domain-containing protein [Corynebacterium glutamicum]|uniref:polysaccharide biosynthesis C-terminal domain-containing protein n=1 Tax=Corynebacterium glutamicum TaxID=1718 RepID=UPI0014657240|nr:NAD-dependent epimerase/dehydratase family protein [Corynebacterium glutamicum]GFK17734.1 epimerase [Corynebacterium glutamicum]